MNSHSLFEYSDVLDTHLHLIALILSDAFTVLSELEDRLIKDWHFSSYCGITSFIILYAEINISGRKQCAMPKRKTPHARVAFVRFVSRASFRLNGAYGHKSCRKRPANTHPRQTVGTNYIVQDSSRWAKWKCSAFSARQFVLTEIKFRKYVYDWIFGLLIR